MNLIYIRVSTVSQSFDSQKDHLLKKYGDTDYKIFEEKASGKSMNRSALQELLDYAREGDTLICYDLSRLGRTTMGVLKLLEDLDKRGIKFISDKENFDTSTSFGKFAIQILASLNELNRSVINEKVRAGIESARSRGKVGGRPRLAQEKIDYALFLYDQKKLTISEITKQVNISVGSLYSAIRERKEAKLNEN